MSNFERFDRQLFYNYAPAIAYVEVESNDKTRGIGTAFHVGSGVYVTARHVVENKEIIGINHVIEVSHEKGVGFIDEVGDDEKRKQLPIKGPLFHPDPAIDIACFTLYWYPQVEIEIGFHSKAILYGKYDFLLDKCLIMGFPPVPFSGEPSLLVTLGEVNACITRYDHKYDHYIISTMARGGFSGAPAIVSLNEELGIHAGSMALGIVTESLAKNDEPTELGYLTVLTAEPIYECLDYHGLNPQPW